MCSLRCVCLLSLIPLLSGDARRTKLASGAHVTPKDERFLTSPVPGLVHIVSVRVPLSAWRSLAIFLFSILTAAYYQGRWTRSKP